jgi:hypothetical protein
MEYLDLPSSLLLVWDLKRAIETNQSVKVGLLKFIERDLKTLFATTLKKWAEQNIKGHKTDINLAQFNMHQRLVIEILQKGLQGMSIYESLIELNTNMIGCCDDDIEKHVALLPLLLQIPLLGLLFPAILMLLVVPAVKMLNI